MRCLPGRDAQVNVRFDGCDRGNRPEVYFFKRLIAGDVNACSAIQVL
jgi:hypothetical protein